MILILSITITVIVIGAFGVSYGYYAYMSANTLFNVSTIKSLPTVTYAQSSNLNETVGIPIDENNYATEASKSQFTITYGSNLSDYDIAVKISLSNITIDSALKNNYFKYKLVRDNIPNIIKNNGEDPITRILTNEEYKQELEKKLYEEYQEVLESSGEDRIEELADMLEVIKALAKLENKCLEDIINIANQKNSKRGSFNDKIFLEKVITNNK